VHAVARALSSSQAGSPLPALPKGAAITLGTGGLDLQANPMHYKATDETAKFEQVGTAA